MAKRQKQEIDMAAFAADVRADMSTSQLAAKYCRRNFAKAKKLREAIESKAASDGEAALDASPAADPAPDAGEVSEETHWGVPLNIRKDRVAATLEKLDNEEIAAAVLKCDGDTQVIVLTAIMQRRLDAELLDEAA